MDLELFVSPAGQDVWNGLSPTPAADGCDGPLKTVQEGLLRARKLRQQLRAPGRVVLTLRGGLYRLNEPLHLGPADRGLILRAFPGENPVLSGGTQITRWTETTRCGQRCWVANVDREMEFIPRPRSLYAGYEHRPRAAFPKEGWLRIAGVPDVGEIFDLFDGSSRFRVQPGDFDPAWRNPTDIDALVSHLWTEERMPFAGWEPGQNLFRSTHTSIFTLKNQGWMDALPFARYRWENVFEALAEPGEWYLDRPARTLYYLPRENERIGETAVYLPHLLQLVRVHGDDQTGRPAEDIHLEGLSFAHTDWAPVDAWGRQWDPYTEPSQWRAKDSFNHFRDTCPSKMRQHPWPPGVRFAGMPQAAHDLGGALSFDNARHCSVTGCAVLAVGQYAIDLRAGCQHLEFLGNRLEQLGAGGIKADGADADGPPERQTHHLRICDNVVAHGGLAHASAVGLALLHTARTEVAHNEIHHFFYTGISVGWTWGFADTVCREHDIAFNHIHHIGLGRLSDMGGIYCLGRQPGTILRGNHIHAVQGAHYGGWGIYLDYGSSQISVQGNLVHDVGSQGLHEHWGRQNRYQDNVFALCRGGGVLFAREEGDGTLPFPPKGAAFFRNVVLGADRPAVLDCMTYLEAAILESDLNLFWDLERGAAGVLWHSAPWPELRQPTVALDLPALQARGLDRHSRVADPAFADPRKGDFSPAPDSPAAILGIRVLDPTQCGPRAPERRVDRVDRTFRPSPAIRFADQ